MVDYFDQNRKRHIETFKTKRAADDRLHEIAGEVRAGTHTAASESVTVKEAAADWITRAELNEREQSTIDQYRQHVNLHIVPLIGNETLARLTVPAVEAFRDKLLDRASAKRPDDKISRATAKKVLASLKGILREAQRRGKVAQNVAADVRVEMSKRNRRSLEIGRDIPSRDEVKAIIDASEGRWRPLIITAIFSGLRASELRGLLWDHVDFEGKVIHVRQRADRYGEIGNPKSETSRRDVPIPDIVVNTLKEWRLQCPRHGKSETSPGELWLVFPNGLGKIESHANIYNRGLVPAQIAAAVTVDTGEVDKDGNPILAPKYALHAFRHFYASWLINRKKDGGLELPAKTVQSRLGHSSIQITMDLYSHLFPADDGHHKELSDGARLLLG
ncbi:MAG: tyrosine-type recombinase/integrase [Rhodospirillales bacterium]